MSRSLDSFEQSFKTRWTIIWRFLKLPLIVIETIWWSDLPIPFDTWHIYFPLWWGLTEGNVSTLVWLTSTLAPPPGDNFEPLIKSTNFILACPPIREAEIKRRNGIPMCYQRHTPSSKSNIYISKDSFISRTRICSFKIVKKYAKDEESTLEVWLSLNCMRINWNCFISLKIQDNCSHLQLVSRKNFNM